MYRSTISASVSAPFSRILSMNVTICSRKAAEELLRTDTLSRTAVISFFADYRYYPNQVVYHKIMDALTKQDAVKE